MTKTQTAIPAVGDFVTFSRNRRGRVTSVHQHGDRLTILIGYNGCTFTIYRTV